MSNPASYSRNVKLICAFKALQMALFPLAIITLFWKQQIEMSMTDIMIVQAVLAATIVIVEFPSGYLADRFGYRLTLICSALLATAGWGLYLFADSFWLVVIAEMLYGASMALVSGTDHSMMYESLCEIDKQADYPRWSGRMQAFGQVGEGVAALTAASAYILHTRLPFMLEVVVCVINVGIACLLVEPSRLKPAFGKTLEQIKDIVHFVAVKQTRLRDLMILSLVLGISTFIPVWLIQLYAQEAGAGLQVLSFNWAFANLIVAAGAFVSYRVNDSLGFTRSVIICIVLALAGYLGLGLNHMTYGFVFYYLITFMRGLNGPVLMNEKQKLVTSENRAGMLSLQSLVFRAIFIVIGPTVGVSVDLWGMHAVFIALGIILAGAAVLSLVNLTRQS